MTREQALEIIKQVAALYVGTLKEHEQIQLAIKEIEGKETKNS